MLAVKDGAPQIKVYLVAYNIAPEMLRHFLQHSARMQKYFKLELVQLQPKQRLVLEQLSFSSPACSPSQYLKFFLPELIVDEQVLVLDAKTLILGDIYKLLHHPLPKSKLIAGARDHLLEATIEQGQYWHHFVRKAKPEALSQDYLVRFVDWFKTLHIDAPQLTQLRDGLPETGDLPVKRVRFKCYHDAVLLMDLAAMRGENLQAQFYEYLTSQVNALPYANLFLNLVLYKRFSVLPDAYDFQVDYIGKDLAGLSKHGRVKKFAEINQDVSYQIPVVVSYSPTSVAKLKPLPFRKIFYALSLESLQTVHLKRAGDFQQRAAQASSSYPYIHLLRLDAEGNYINTLAEPTLRLGNVDLVG